MRLISWMRKALGLRASDPALNEGYWTTMGEGGVPSSSGFRVSATSAMRVSAVYRCVSLLASTTALLPGGVYRRLARGREEVPDHPVWSTLWRRPNPYQLPFEFKRVMLAWAILRGAAFARIVRRFGGEVELWPLHPDQMRGPDLLDNGTRRYYYRDPKTSVEEPLLAGSDLLVFTGLSLDGVRGLAMTDLARETVGLAAATEQYGATLFSRGARFSGALQLPPGRTIADKDARQRLAESIRGAGAGAYNPETGTGWWGVPVLEDGMTWSSISMSNDDAQFLETRKFAISDIARWFGVPPHMIGDVERTTSWGTGIEHQTISFVTYGLMPWLTLFEQAIAAALIPEPELYVRFNVGGLLRADIETRFKVYDLGIRNGIWSPNDCRELEDENPRPDGDVYVTPTAPQQAAVSTGEEGSGDGDESEDETEALARQVAALEARLAVLETQPVESEQTPGAKRARALEAFRAGASELGVPVGEVRKILAQAKPREEKHHV